MPDVPNPPAEQKKHRVEYTHKLAVTSINERTFLYDSFHAYDSLKTFSYLRLLISIHTNAVETVAGTTCARGSCRHAISIISSRNSLAEITYFGVARANGPPKWSDIFPVIFLSTIFLIYSLAIRCWRRHDRRTACSTLPQTQESVAKCPEARAAT